MTDTATFPKTGPNSPLSDHSFTARKRDSNRHRSAHIPLNIFRSRSENPRGLITIFRSALHVIFDHRQLRHRLKHRPGRLATAACDKLTEHILEVIYILLNHLHARI